MAEFEIKHNKLDLFFNETGEMYRNLIESVKNGIYIADSQGILFFVNQAFVEIYGYNRKEDVLGLDIAKHLYENPSDRKEFLRQLERVGFVKNYEIKCVRKDGVRITLSVTSNIIRNEQGHVIGFQGVFHDITRRKQLEEKLLLEKLKFEELLGFDEKISSIRKLDQLVDFIVEKTTAILKADKCSLMLYDDTTRELCIKGAKGLSPEVITKTRVKLGESIAGQVAKEGQYVLVTNIEYDRRFERKSRESYKGRSFICASIKMKDRLIGVINVADKNTNDGETFDKLDLKVLCAIVRQSAIAIENAKLYRELEYLSVTDPITQLSNYRYFVDSLEDEIQRFKRFSETFSLLMIDVDDFKSYNDTFGHLEGDIFLKELGKIFMKNLRIIDKVCRYGGDEFVVLLPGTKASHAKIVAEKLRRIIQKAPFKRKVTVSIGISQFKCLLSRFEFTMRVDRAMYQAKRNGKNRIYIETGADHTEAGPP